MPKMATSSPSDRKKIIQNIDEKVRTWPTAVVACVSEVDMAQVAGSRMCERVGWQRARGWKRGGRRAESGGRDVGWLMCGKEKALVG